jgi:hypothetical protein
MIMFVMSLRTIKIIRNHKKMSKLHSKMAGAGVGTTQKNSTGHKRIVLVNAAQPNSKIHSISHLNERAYTVLYVYSAVL